MNRTKHPIKLYVDHRIEIAELLKAAALIDCQIEIQDKKLVLVPISVNNVATRSNQLDLYADDNLATVAARARKCTH